MIRTLSLCFATMCLLVACASDSTDATTTSQPEPTSQTPAKSNGGGGYHGVTSAVMDELDMRMLAVQGVVEEVVKIHYELKEKMDKNDSALMDRLTEFRRIVERTTDQEKEYKLLRTEFIKGAISEADFKKSATPFLDSMDANKTRIEEINKTYFRK